MVLSTETLRNRLMSEVEENLASKTEIRVFFSAWELICERFSGINSVDEKYDPVPFIHCRLMEEIKRNGMVTEEVFISWLLDLPFLNINFVDEKGNVWEPIHESFSVFKLRSKTIQTSDVKGVKEKVEEFYHWVIKLCNWHQSGSVSGAKKKLVH